MIVSLTHHKRAAVELTTTNAVVSINKPATKTILINSSDADMVAILAPALKGDRGPPGDAEALTSLNLSTTDW